MALLCAGVLVGSAGASTLRGGAAVTQLLVKFKPGTGTATHAAALAGAEATAQSTIPGIGVHVVAVPRRNAAGALAGLRRNPAVSFAELDATAEAQGVPNDPSFSLQWGLQKIDAPDAWTYDQGSPTVRVAVLDTGVSLSHPDLAAKIVANKNFSSSTTVDDVNGHGSHVAGIAAAVTNNGIGVAGVGYNVDIMNVKVLGDGGSGTYGAIANGIIWAADNGANVINLSLGGTLASSTLESAVDYAWSKGCVVVAAAGNNASSAPFYPAYYANAMAVAATTDLDRLASFSGYGDWVDVAAPGISIYSTVPGGYGYMSGTSMASPYVAGLAALLFSQVTDTNGDGNLNDEVRAEIQATADNVGVSGIGSGRIDAYRAVTQLGLPSPPANTAPPAISGSAVVGQTLQASTGTWTGDPTDYAYQWQRCDSSGASCTPVPGATLSAYTLVSTDLSSTFRVQVTASNPAGAATATSAASAAVNSGPPLNTTPPAVSGVAQDGRSLQTTDGTWSNAPTSYGYQWLRCDSSGANCVAIAGATASSYALTSTDVGSTIRSQVVASNADGSGSASSTATAVIAAAPPVSTSPPVVSGTPKPGQTLSSSSGSWSGTTPMTFTYQWLRCDSSGAGCAAIGGATAATYAVGSADVGSTLRVQVTAANAGGSGQAASAQTAVVTNLQTLTFTGTLSKSLASLSFPLGLGAGEADVTLTLSKPASVTLKLLNSGGTVVGQVTGKSSPLQLNLAGLAAGSYSYVVSGSGFKGSLGVTLTVTAPAP